MKCSEGRGRTVRWVLIACALPALAMSLIDSLHRLVKEPAPPAIDARYAALRSTLPDNSCDLGYVSDVPIGAGGVGLFFQAQYALAPHLLFADADLPFVVANLKNPSGLSEICRKGRLHALVVEPGGVALLQPVGAR